jgi:hypothetical protein
MEQSLRQRTNAAHAPLRNSSGARVVCVPAAGYASSINRRNSPGTRVVCASGTCAICCLKPSHSSHNCPVQRSQNSENFCFERSSGPAFRFSGEIYACVTDTLLMQWGVPLS